MPYTRRTTPDNAFEQACDRLMDVLARNRIGDADISATIGEHKLCQVNLYDIDEVEQLTEILEQRATTLEALERRGESVRTITPQLLRLAADIYRENINDRPTAAVKRAFMVSDRMASSYVQRARQAGLLPPTSPGKKKA